MKIICTIIFLTKLNCDEYVGGDEFVEEMESKALNHWGRSNI